MLKTFEFWILTVVSGLALALALTNMLLYQQNRELNGRAAERNQYIQQSVALENLYRQIVQELGQRAVRSRDDQIRDLLSEQGFNINFDSQAAPGGNAP
jgi:hypothetical protein